MKSVILSNKCDILLCAYIIFVVKNLFLSVKKLFVNKCIMSPIYNQKSCLALATWYIDAPYEECQGIRNWHVNCW